MPSLTIAEGIAPSSEHEALEEFPHPERSIWDSRENSATGAEIFGLEIFWGEWRFGVAFDARRIRRASSGASQCCPAGS